MNNLILVGVDGSSADRAAIAYAADVSSRTGLDVRLAHVATQYSALVPYVDLDLDEVARQVLEGAVEQAKPLVPEGRLSAVLLHGQRQGALLEAAKEAHLVVLGGNHRSTVERILTGSTTTALAAGARCPVVVVPPEWTANSYRAVGVGVKTLDGAVPLLAEAAAIAESRGHRLEVVHAWHLPVTAYDALAVPEAIDTEGWETDMRSALEEQVRAAVADHPGVELRQRVVEGNPATMLVDLSREVDLLVVARRARLFPRGHLGGTARALLRESQCPVLVVPPPVGGEECPSI